MANGILGLCSPLTVAGAATVLAPDGSSSPCSLFIRRSSVGRNHHMIWYAHAGQKTTENVLSTRPFRPSAARSSRRSKICRGQGHHPTRIPRSNQRPTPRSIVAWLRENPSSNKMRKTRVGHERLPLERANRRLVDPPRMTQRPVTAVETGILSFHAALLGQILHPTGEIVHERMASAEAAVRGGRG